MTSDQKNLTLDYLIALCKRAFPERKKLQIADLTSLGSRQHEMIQFELWWFNDEGTFTETLIARRYVSTLSWWRPDDKGKAQRETTVMRWLDQEGFPVPKVYAREFGAFGDVVLFSRVPHDDLGFAGKPLGEVFAPYVEPFARTLAKLHSIRPTDEVRRVLPWVTLPGALANLTAISVQIDKPELSNAVEQVMPRAYEIEENLPCVIHGDYHFLNALLHEGKISGVIDWEYSAMADPRWDVANVYIQLTDFGAADAANAFLEHYLAHSERVFEGPPVYNVVAPIQQWAISEWIVQKQVDGDEFDFAMADDLTQLRDVHRRRALNALQLLD
jgi:Ser/Thr protein kinase RdoA (MazF antagonist)